MLDPEHLNAARDALRAWTGPIPSDVSLSPELVSAVAASLLEEPIPHVADVLGRWSTWAERDGEEEAPLAG